MKINRIVSLLLVLALMLGASAFAETLWWDFGSTPAPEYVSSDYVLISGGNCYVRSQPNLNGNKLGVLNNGQRANCLGGQSTDSRGVVWYEIDFNGMAGWVSSRYAKLNGTAAVTYLTVVDGDCNMRFQPNLNAEIIEVLREGSRLVYEGRTSTDSRGVDWYYASYNGEEGWVSSKYAKFGTSGSSSTSYGYVKATSYKVNVRSNPNLSGSDIGTMDKGETATYLGQKSTDGRGVVWYKVRFAGKVGWVSSRYSKLYT